MTIMDQGNGIEVPELGIKFSTGLLGKQANGSAVIQLGETTVFVSATAADKVAPDQDFFPLMVDYRERFSAAGKFPGGYNKREGKPSEKEVLTSRLCDRPLRPLFPDGFMNEVQVVGVLLSADSQNEADILFINAASAALLCSDIPWDGPIGCVRVGEIDGNFIVNPNNDQIFESKLDLIYVGNERDMMMIEGSADQISEARFVEALEFAHGHIQSLIAAQRELAKHFGKKKRTYPLFTVNPEVLKFCKQLVGDRLSAAVFQEKKLERQAAVTALMDEAREAAQKHFGDTLESYQINMVFEKLQEHLYRYNVLQLGKRADGRDTETVRSIQCGVGVLPRVHGSALFSRGETQALVTATLGNSRDAQNLDALTGGAESKSFVLHYNFPPYSVGEVGRMTGSSRREIGHGALAERSLLPVLPAEDVFPYAIRVVSDIMESNGSSSMASVCGGCLALMDAGVPIAKPVAGISLGLVTSSTPTGKIDQYVLITDIIGNEDHFGDMDFKIAGTEDGITGFQLDLKLQGLPLSIAKEAIYKNREARIKILDIMRGAIAEPREQLREHAPRVHAMQIQPDRIGALIGPGGKNIKRITELSGAQIDINEDNSGRLLIFANNETSMQRAIREVELVAADIELGKTYKGIVKSIKEFGVFVECMPGKEGLVHISELAECRINKAEDVCKMGDTITVKCIGVDDKGKVRLSRKAVLFEARGETYVPSESPSHRRGPRRDRRE